MSDQTNWDTQPKAGWNEFQAARARFRSRPRPGRVADAPDHVETSNGDGVVCDCPPGSVGDGAVVGVKEPGAMSPDELDEAAPGG
jgi:hypothetical protein